MGRVDSPKDEVLTTQVANVKVEVKNQDAQKGAEQKGAEQKGAEQRSEEDISTQDVMADLTTIPEPRADEPSKSRRLNLRSAVKIGSLIDVQLLINSPDVDPDETDQDSRTALWWAAWSKGAGDNAKVTELLLANDRLDINVADDCARTPLYAASYTGNVEVVELLLAEANLEVNARCNREPYEGSTPLHVAVDRRHKEVVRLLLTRHDIDVNSTDSKGNTPLHMTIAENRIDRSIARQLLAKKDVNPTMENRNGRSLLEAAACFGYSGFVDEMLSSENTLGKNPHRVRQALAMVAAGEGHVQVLKTLLKHTEDLRSGDKFRRTPLHCASENGRLDAVKLLLGLPGIDVHAKDSRDQTPLFLAVRREVTAVEKLFLAHDGAYKTEEPSHSRALLRYAVQTGEVGVVQLLLEGEEGQEIYDNTLDVYGHTLMWSAVEKGDEAMMRKLREWDHTTLHSLVNKGEQASVEGLLKTGYNPDTKNVYGQTALHLAILQNRLKIAKVLIESNANVDCRDASKNTPMRLAVERKSYGIINLLLSKSAHVRSLLANDWLKAYDEKTSKVVLLREEPERRQSIKFIDTDIGTAELQRVTATAEVNRRLFLLPSCLLWQKSHLPHSSMVAKPNELKTLLPESADSEETTFSMLLWFPAGSNHEIGKHFKVPDGGQCRITWTTASTCATYCGTGTPSMDHFSTLPCGWLPDDGVDFIGQFLESLILRWRRLCEQGKDHLATCRLDQLQAKGQRQEIILRLAQDAQTWSDFRKTLTTQMRTATAFVEQYCRLYNKGQHEKYMINYIESRESSIAKRINTLDQKTRDLMQLEFAWVSITEAHRSTSLATSMKRLSWVTFIFLPAMFASSLFGMNVNVLTNDPDWRWALLSTGICITSTMSAWLIFRFFPIELWLEEKVGDRIARLTRSRKDARERIDHTAVTHQEHA
ncbi:hypothetical protein HBH98_076040 [Parastagonospora nodorum]|nr:hypothetical protein HBH50_046540 [Parastagonospora nodorum]KAH4082014.1 hypothetical protein HBH48_188610 [Parastagonospora nodorum]KAH4285346.1 hypothetical protein HBI02_231720 [Parastagonospora nodorum]KAH4303463.1 hypothetical protein HBI01_080920 [Parastagonospora nodorum]KAH4331584.1 hypothetical protein HBI00_063260 [Parastagonospora nodorum]